LPTFNTRFEVPLSLTVSGTGVTTASFTGAESFSADARIYLRDNYLGQVTDITATPSVSFNVTADPASAGTARFTLVFVPNGVTSAKETVTLQPALHVWPNPSTDASSINIELTHFAGNQANLTLRDVTGKVVRNQAIASTGAELSTKALTPGVYTLVVQGANHTLQQRIIIK
jgi:hypothetical protein